MVRGRRRNGVVTAPEIPLRERCRRLLSPALSSTRVEEREKKGALGR